MKQRHKYIDPSLVLATVICTVIGVGIFYKNEGVFQVTQNNWKEVIVAWCLVAFICTCTAFTYSRISLLHNTDLGYCGWAETIINRKFSCFVSQIYILFKLGICIPAFCFYAASSFLKIFQNDQYLLNDGMGKFSSLGLIFLIGMMILVGSMLFNYLRPTQSIFIQKIFLYSKFVPIIMVVLFGVAISWMKRDGGLFASNAAPKSPFSMTNAIVAAPGIMMAFDAFLNAGFFAKRLKNPEKQLPKIYMSSIIFFIAVYLLITVNQILCGEGSAPNIFSPEQLGNWGSKIIKGIFLFFVFLSAVGLVNGYSNTMLSVIQQSFNDDCFYVKEYFLRRFRDIKRAAFAFWIALTVFWVSLMMLISLSTGSDMVFDGLTNVPTLFMFSVYGVLAGAYGYQQIRDANWKRLDSRKKCDLSLVCATSLIAFLGWLGIAIYQFGYICFYLPVFGLMESFEKWKGPWNSGAEIRNWHASLIVFVCIFASVFFYWINDHLQRKNKLSKEGDNAPRWATRIF